MERTKDEMIAATGTAGLMMPLYMACIATSQDKPDQEARARYLEITANVIGMTAGEVFPVLDSDLIRIIGMVGPSKNGDLKSLAQQMAIIRPKYANDPARREVCRMVSIFINAARDKKDLPNLLNIFAFMAADAMFLADRSTPWEKNSLKIRKLIRKELRGPIGFYKDPG